MDNRLSVFSLTGDEVKQKSGRPTARSLSYSRSLGCDKSAVVPCPTSSSSAMVPIPLGMDNTPDTRYHTDSASFEGYQSASNGMATLDNLSNWDLSFLSTDELSPSTCPTEDLRTTPSSNASFPLSNTSPSGETQSISKTPHVNHQQHPPVAPSRENQAELWIEQLAGLTISLFRSAQHTACPDSAPLTVVSPHIDGVFKATSIMINIVQSLGQKNADRLMPKIACVNSSPAGTPISSPDFQTPDPHNGVVFLVLACQEQLLSVFKTICLSIQRDISLMAGGITGNPPSPNNERGPAESIASRNLFLDNTLDGGGTPSMAQSVMVMQLLSHLLSRLNQAFDLVDDKLDSLDDDNALRGSDGRRHNASWKESQNVKNTPEGLAVRPTRNQTGEKKQNRGSHAITETAKGLIEGMRDQHTSIQLEIEALQKRIGGSRIL